MDNDDTVIDNGAVYIDGAVIVAVQAAAAPMPAGFEDARIVETGATIYPGFIDIHNHLPYDVLPMWQVPEKFGDRSQWHLKTYEQLVSAPMELLGTHKDLLPATIRYVECKALIGGTTTGQGIMLRSAPSAARYFKGTLRTAEDPGVRNLPAARSHIFDVEQRDAAQFAKLLTGPGAMLLHLAEGTDAAAHNHFLALQYGNSWAVTKYLAGIHSVGVTSQDWKSPMAPCGAALVWSPLSNYLLYGATADITTAASNGIRIALGPDWTFSGSKNLLGELKVARLVSKELQVFEDVDLVAMVTRNAANILGWNALLGSIQANKLADVTAISVNGDPYSGLFGTGDAQVALTMIGGRAAYGDAGLMRQLGAQGEAWSVGGKAKTIALYSATESSIMQNVTLHDATATLTAALADLDEVRDTMRRQPGKHSTVSLVLDEQDPAIQTPGAIGAEQAVSHPDVPLVPIKLDPLTVADDADYFSRLESQKNLPSWSKTLRTMYG